MVAEWLNYRTILLANVAEVPAAAERTGSSAAGEAAGAAFGRARRRAATISDT